jgi:hypothetical protein
MQPNPTVEELEANPQKSESKSSGAMLQAFIFGESVSESREARRKRKEAGVELDVSRDIMNNVS